MIGKTISHYRVIEKIGEGGMGVVYLAEHTLLGRRVAIKTLVVGGSENQHFRSRFLREAQAVSKLSHPNIANIYDYGETDDGQPYIVMELVEGQTLNEVMRAETLTIARAIDVVTQVAQALSEAHRHGIVHRDIKPSNIAINERGIVKVLDFGLAKHASSAAEILESNHSSAEYTQTREGVIVGTPLYLSPEQALGLEVDARSDLFSLGSVLYECIAGRPPFTGKSDIDICAKVIRDDPSPPSQFNNNVSPGLDRLSLKALSKKPEARFQTAGEMIAALDSIPKQAEMNGSRRMVTRVMSSVSRTQGTGALATLSDIFKQPRLSIGYVAAGLLIVAAMVIAGWYFTRPKLRPPKPEAQRLYDRGVEAMRQGSFFRASKLLQQAVQEDDQFALAYARLAECGNELDSSDQAQGNLIRALALVPDPSVLPTVDGLKLQAVTKTVQRDFGKAVEDYRALVAAVPANEKPFALFDLGRAYEKDEKPDKAIEAYQDATKLDSRRAAAFLRLGVMLGRSQRFSDAYGSLDQAYKLFDTDSEIEGLIEVLLQRAVILNLQLKSDEARSQLLQALEKSAVLEAKDKRIKVLLNLSNTEIMAGNPDQSRQYSSQAVELARANGLDNLTMQGLIDIGNAYMSKGNFAEAEKNFTEALRLAELYKGERSRARALLQLSSLRSKQGDLDAARDFFQRALPFYQQGGYRKELFALYAILARAEVEAEEYDSAQGRFEQLLQRAQQANDVQATAWAQEGLGKLHLARQNLPKALSHYRANYETVKSLNAKLFIGYAANSLAEALSQLGKMEEARVAITEASTIAQPEGKEPFKDLLANVVLTKARMALRERRFADAKVEAVKSLEINAGQAKSILIEANSVLGLAESLSDRTAEGRKRCEQAVKIAREGSSPLLLSNALLAFAESVLLAGDASAALTIAAEAQQRFASAKQHESEWRTLLVEARACEKVGDRARAHQLAQQATGVLQALQQEWGAEGYQSYLERADVEIQNKQLSLSRVKSAL